MPGTEEMLKRIFSFLCFFHIPKGELIQDGLNHSCLRLGKNISIQNLAFDFGALNKPRRCIILPWVLPV